jgi:hypothetical protein
MRSPLQPSLLLPLVCGLAVAACGGGGTEPTPSAATLSIATEPTGGSSGSVLATQPVIRVLDAGGALVREGGTVVTASIASGTGTLSGATAVTATAGIATFTDLRIIGAGAHSLRFSAGTLMPAVSGSFTILGPPAAVVFASGRAIVDAGTSLPASFTVRDAAGDALSAPLVFTSRDPAIATVDAGGTIAGVARGQTIVVASVAGSPAIADSLLAVIATPGGPVLYTSLTGFSLGQATSIVVSVYLDMRGSTRRLGSGQLDVRFTPAQMSYTSMSSLGFVPEINASGAGAGLVRLSFADPNGAAGPVIEIARLTFVTGTGAGTKGSFALSASELTASDYTDLTGSTTQVTQPLVLR